MFREEVVELDDGENVVRGEVCSGIDVRAEEGPSPVYKKEEPLVLGAKTMGSKMRRLFSSIISVSRKKKMTATRSESGEKTESRELELKR